MNSEEITVAIAAFIVAVFGLVFCEAIFGNREQADKLMEHIFASAPVLFFAFWITFAAVLVSRIFVEGK